MSKCLRLVTCVVRKKLVAPRGGAAARSANACIRHWRRPVNSSHSQLVTCAELTVFLCGVNRCFLDTLWRVDCSGTVNSSHGQLVTRKGWRVDRQKSPAPTLQISFEVQFECCVMWEQAYVSRLGWERVWQRMSLYFMINTDNLSQWL